MAESIDEPTTVVYPTEYWEIAQDEDEVDFILFTYFLEMTPTRRSVRGALRRAGLTECNQRVYTVSDAWEWGWRAHQYDKWRHRLRQEKIYQAQTLAQDVLIDSAVAAANALKGALSIVHKEQASSGRVRVQAAKTILSMLGVGAVEVTPLDSIPQSIDEVEEVTELVGSQEDLERMADWDEEE